MSTVLEPVEVKDLDLSFGAGVMSLLPAWGEIPYEFKIIIGIGETKWNRVITDWMYGSHRKPEFVIKPGIDSAKALRHIRAILGSFEPKHEHKMAGCAYLLSQWFEDVRYRG